MWSERVRWSVVQGVVCLAAGVGLAACGGGSSGDVPETTPAPVSDQTAGAVPDEMALGARLNAAELQRAADGLDASSAKEASSAFAPKATGDTRVAVYRFFNTATATHFYTASASERDRIVASLPVLRYEGPAFYASGAAATALSPVYRFYNTTTGVHFYTISEDEKNNIIANLAQFSYEGVAYYASKVAGADMLKPLFRFYILSKGVHFFTASASEADSIRANLPDYRYEGVAYYVPLGQSESAPAKIYKGLAAPTTQAAALSQTSSEGASGYTYVTDYFFASFTQQGAIYFNDQGRPTTYQTKILSTAVDSASGKVTALGVQGGLGYGYQGDATFSGNGAQVYARHVKPTPGVGAMSYVAVAAPVTQATYLTMLNQQGSNGFRYLGPVTYGANTSALFEKSSQRGGPFMYRMLASSGTAATFEAAANAQGAEGYAFKGPLVVGGVSYDIYAKDGGRYAIYHYKTAAINAADNMAAVMAALNVEGAKGYYWFGPMAFGATTYSIYYKGNYVCPPFGGCSSPDGL
ncbi:MAG: hypothetical protein R3E56_03690 [Burkholderiaceae bacterium]